MWRKLPGKTPSLGLADWSERPGSGRLQKPPAEAGRERSGTEAGASLLDTPGDMRTPSCKGLPVPISHDQRPLPRLSSGVRPPHDRAMETARLIDLLDLQPHPEGGWYAETFRSPVGVSLPDGRERSAVTAIHFLLKAGGFSAWHRVSSDEIWHFQRGNPLELVTIDPNGGGAAVTTLLGPDLARGMKTHHAVPAGWWQAARPVGPEGHTLMVCTVSPGFDFADFEMPGREELLGLLPGQRDLILEFTRP